MEGFQKFITMLRQTPLFDKANLTGQIVVVDDSTITLDLMRGQFERLNLKKRVHMFQDGQQAFNFFES